MKLTATIPGVPPSPNERERMTHWQRRRVTKRWKRDAAIAVLGTGAASLLFSELSRSLSPVAVTLRRIGPRLLDAHDRLPGSLADVVDGIADALLPGRAPGRADGDPRLKWRYEQMTTREAGGEPRVEVEIEW